MKLSPYLVFNGQCHEAFSFYEQALGGKIVTMLSYGSRRWQTRWLRSGTAESSMPL
jgi:uncharacterized glyoxalase superfamily protein PhnB